MIAPTREGSGIVLVHERVGESEKTNGSPPHAYAAESQKCSWWRRGRVELGLKHGLAVLVVISWLKNPGFTTRN